MHMRQHVRQHSRHTLQQSATQHAHAPLDLGRLGVCLACLVHKRAAVRVDVLAHIIVLGQVEELADLGRALGAAHARLLLISEARKLLLALLYNLEVEHRQVGRDDAAAHRLAATLAAAAAVAAEALLADGHKQAHTLIGQHALAHAKALLVVATHDLEDVALHRTKGPGVLTRPQPTLGKPAGL
eukprot:361200-Chlamydomonas_euryale.AAC.16